MDTWQEQWGALIVKAAWTKTLIPDVKPWVNRTHGQVDYHLAQALSGHGAYNAYLFRIGKTDDDTCTYCDRKDTPEHTLFHCPK